MTDLRRLRSRVPFGLLATFARNLQAGVARLDAVGGDVVAARVPGLPPVYLVRHPDVLRELLIDRDADFTKARGLRLARQILGDGLLTSEPPDHTRRRRLVLPAFHHGRLVGYGEAMVTLADAEASRWTDGAPFDAAAAMSRLALAIAGRTLFGADVLPHADRVATAVHDAMAAFDGAQFPLADKLTWLPLSANRTSRRARAILDDVVYQVIADHRASGDTDDLLGILLDARDEETGEALTDLELRDEAMTLFLAGHETTAAALAWTWLLLAQHPKAEARLHAEVDGLPADLSLASLAALPYSRAVFAESMRLFPPAWAVGREAARDTSLGGHPVPRRSTVLFAPLHLHRDARYWDAPDVFRPERHLVTSNRPKFAYLPFSAGRRGCIGERFAWAEGTLVLAAIARRWRLALDGEPPEPHGSVTLRPAGALWMRPVAR
ncbi:cytochrome P450 [Rubrivirga sp. IMCC43871]|uniref:cytochrome P450 n=1 Tax=Rubrivirga sp. IMCC43871 TaxID=3391575 RepID=UPI00398FC86A